MQAIYGWVRKRMAGYYPKQGPRIDSFIQLGKSKRLAWNLFQERFKETASKSETEGGRTWHAKARKAFDALSPAEKDELEREAKSGGTELPEREARRIRCVACT